MYMIEHEDLEHLKYVFESCKVDITRLCKNKQNMLMLAARCDQVEIFKFL